jgi:hypothetical protein
MNEILRIVDLLLANFHLNIFNGNIFTSTCNILLPVFFTHLKI